jgi:hypothetical protein
MISVDIQSMHERVVMPNIGKTKGAQDKKGKA